MFSNFFPDDKEELSSSTRMLLELLKRDHDALIKDGTCSLLAILLNETDENWWKKMMTKSTYKTLLIKLLDNKFISKVIFIHLGTLPQQQHSTSLMIILNVLLNHKSLKEDIDITSKLQTLVKVCIEKFTLFLLEN